MVYPYMRSPYDLARCAGKKVYFSEGTDTMRLCPSNMCLLVRENGRWLAPSRKAWVDCGPGERFPAPDKGITTMVGFDWNLLVDVVAKNEAADGETMAAALAPLVETWSRA